MSARVRGDDWIIAAIIMVALAIIIAALAGYLLARGL